LPKILRAAKLAQGPFLVLFWASKKDPPPAKGMEAGEGKADPTGSRAKGALALTS
jgi:hypothetical protein